MSIICGDCIYLMKEFPDNYFSAVVTDPPYGLSFMGKGWDYAVPDVNYWKECIRVSKPGSFLIAMGGTRTFHRLTCAIEDAGYEIRDCISWLYGSGFPKSHNHFGLEGYGTALKPAWEPCIIAMKPLDGTFRQNAEKWGQAGINIDGCRIVSEPWSRPSRPNIRSGNYCNSEEEPVPRSNDKGRWPANVILDEEAGEMLDEQSGQIKGSVAGTVYKTPRYTGTTYANGKVGGLQKEFGYSDSGGASRFFYCPKASSSERNEGLEGFAEKPSYMVENGSNTSGVNGERYDRTTTHKNNHPTVKPLKLMEYLIKLVMPPKDGILLDPFAGSGTTILAARRLGFEAIGIEKSEEYCEIARGRIRNVQKTSLTP